MPDRRRRDDIVAAVAAYDNANPDAPLPRIAVRLLEAMFGRAMSASRSHEALQRQGSAENRLPRCLRAPRRGRHTIAANRETGGRPTRRPLPPPAGGRERPR